MRITTISYGRTLSDGNFGSYKAEMTAELESGDHVQTGMDMLRTLVLDNLHGRIEEVAPVTDYVEYHST